ncbi:MAG: GDP-L-fucose synthase, partial [Pseudomonadota bacterium]
MHLAEHYAQEGAVNVGSGEEITIRDLAALVCSVVGFDGGLTFDASKPDGTPRKVADSGVLRGLGWRPTVALRDGIADAYRWFLDNPPAGVTV